MYRIALFLKLVTLAILCTVFASVIAHTELSAAQLTLSWSDNSNNEDGFRVERKTGTAGTYVPIISLPANAGSHVDSNLSAATTFCYRVNAFNATGSSGYSNEGCATTASVTSSIYLLTVSKVGTGSGTVMATGINCGSDCSESVVSGTQVALTATAASGSMFAGWTGTGCASTVTVTGNLTCTATFNSSTFTLTVAKAGTGNGTVTATGINCGSDCSESVVSGTQVALTATAANGSTFAGWTGTGCASTVKVTGNLTCTATFNSSTFTLTVAKAGTGNGTVTATGINCGSDCSESVVSGTQVALTATAANGSTFAGWTGTGCASTVTVTGNLTCTATFNSSTFTLTVAKAGTGNGTVTATGINCGSDCSESVVSGTQVALTATAANGSTFAGWTGTGCASTVTVTGNLTCTATFNSSTFTLTVAKVGTGNGTVTATGINCGSDCSESVVSGTQVALTATAANGSTFAGWTGTGCASTVTVTGNLTCTATFNSSTFTLTVAKAGTGNGTVTATGINCGSDCSESVVSGTQVALTATAANGSTFAGWTGTGCASTVTVTGNLTCTATFNSSTFTLTVAKVGTGNGTVTATGINCGSDCSESVVSGTQVALTATAANGSTFAGWTGTGCASTVTVTGNLTCTATFNSSTFTLTVAKAGTGNGTVTATGINCGSDCSESVVSGTQVALTATAANGSTFAGWTGTGCASTVTVTGNLTCTATFNSSTFTLTVAKAGTGNGTVTATGINCGSDCSESVVSGTQVALTATAANGSTFAGWTGTGCASTVTVTGNLTCTATFNSSTFTLTVAKAGTGNGTVTATGINCGSDCSESVVSGTQVALTATAASGSTFSGWTGTGCASTVTVTGNLTCTATFNSSTFTLTVAKVGTGSGTVMATGINCGSDCSESVVSGTQVALTATAANGSTFAGWTGTGCASTVTVTGNLTCTATFNSTGPFADRIGVYRPSTGEWFLDQNGNGAWDNCQIDLCIASYGVAGSVPVVGEWDASGVTQLGLFGAESAQWFMDKNTNETWDGCAVDLCLGPFGVNGDLPVVGKWTSGDYDGVGIFRPSTGYWLLDKNSDGSLVGRCRKDQCAYLSVYMTGDLPVVGDWKGVGVSQLGLFRPSTGEWFLDYNGNKSWNGCSKERCMSFGEAGDQPATGDWNGSGTSKIGVFRPSTSVWYLDYNGNGIWDGCGIDVCAVNFGVPGDIAVVGKW